MEQMKKLKKCKHSKIFTVILILSLFICSTHYQYANAATKTSVNLQYAENFYNDYAENYVRALKVKSVKSLTNNELVYFDYDNSGNRVREYLDKVNIDYNYDTNNRLINRNINDQNISFEYENINSNKVIAINSNKKYNLVYDDQGNVNGLEDVDNNLIAKYEYNKNVCIVFGKNGNDEWVDMTSNNEFIGNINPIRQNGQYYDCHTGYYMIDSCVYDIQNSKYIMDDQYIRANKSNMSTLSSSGYATTAAVSPGVIDIMANSYLANSSYGKSLSYSSGWYSSLSTIELLARLIYGECVYTSDEPGVAWELMNRYAAKWSGFYGSGKSNSLWNIATKSSAYSAITSNSANTAASRAPSISSQRWISATWYACALYNNTNRSELASLITKPTGMDKQCYHVGLVLRNSFSGTTASTLKYNSNNIKSVIIITKYSNITTAQTIKNQYESNPNYNVFFTYTSELGTNYTIN